MLPIPETLKEEPIKKTKSKKVKEAPLPINMDGMVIYADAGVRPTNPGPGGWGIHGYTYSINVPKKGSGNSDAILTKYGYKNKKEDNTLSHGNLPQITPINYIDGFGTIQHATNNAAELVAAINGMKFAYDLPIKNLLVYTDSSYVVKGTEEYLYKWKNNNWKKTDGTEISNKNYWQNLEQTYSSLKDKDIKIEFKWVRGHNGDIGNELADTYATMGAMSSMLGKTNNAIVTTKAEGYWGAHEDKHPFITHRRLYFITNSKFTIPGEYYLGEHGKDDDLLGKRMTDGAYSYLLLTEPNIYIEKLRNKQIKESIVEDAFIMCLLNHLLADNVCKDIDRFGDSVLYRPKKHLQDLYVVTKLKTLKVSEDTGETFVSSAGTPITRELNPPRIASRAIDALNTIKGVMVDFINNKDTLIKSTNITNQIYTIDDKKEFKLLPKFITGYSELTVKNIDYLDNTTDGVELTLSLGFDIPERNVLKKLEKYKPEIYLLTWKEANVTVRYATYIVLKDNADKITAQGIWCAFYTNFKYLNK